MFIHFIDEAFLMKDRVLLHVVLSKPFPRPRRNGDQRVLPTGDQPGDVLLPEGAAAKEGRQGAGGAQGSRER